MPPVVSPEVAEKAWQRIGALGEADVLELQKRAGNFQQELVGFVLGFASRLSPEAMGIALYAMLVVFEMFQTAAPRIIKVSDPAIMRLWNQSRPACDQLLAADFDKALMDSFVAHSPEPAALQYVLDALVDAQDESGELDAEDVAHVLAIHSTLITALHDAVRPSAT